MGENKKVDGAKYKAENQLNQDVLDATSKERHNKA